MASHLIQFRLNYYAVLMELFKILAIRSCKTNAIYVPEGTTVLFLKLKYFKKINNSRMPNAGVL